MQRTLWGEVKQVSWRHNDSQAAQTQGCFVPKGEVKWTVFRWNRIGFQELDTFGLSGVFNVINLRNFACWRGHQHNSNFTCTYQKKSDKQRACLLITRKIIVKIMSNTHSRISTHGFAVSFSDSDDTLLTNAHWIVLFVRWRLSCNHFLDHPQFHCLILLGLFTLNLNSLQKTSDVEIKAMRERIRQSEHWLKREATKDWK